MSAIGLAERRLLPDWLIRSGIRQLLTRRLRAQCVADANQAVEQFATELRQQPVAVNTDAANEQHYEVPAAFFERVLGPRLKYSCCLFDSPRTTLAAAETAMLRLTAERAGLRDGQQILDLGCGWGSFSLWAAAQFPAAQVVGVSNSTAQRDFILARAGQLGIANLEITTADVRELELDRKFDVVVSIEMFEHMRNYEVLLHRIAAGLHDGGQLFVHIFCHRNTAYKFEVDGNNDWMARHFFTGGLMPSYDLLTHFQDDLRLVDRWEVNGDHYARTCEAWLDRLDQQSTIVQHIFEELGSPREASIQVQRWRMFFMACAELFRYNLGHEWFVGHYLFQKD
jgi:cyclopropane-fatty-acyl-phospholipid synthase